jgi:hypothetical protein
MLISKAASPADRNRSCSYRNIGTARYTQTRQRPTLTTLASLSCGFGTGPAPLRLWISNCSHARARAVAVRNNPADNAILSITQS